MITDPIVNPAPIAHSTWRNTSNTYGLVAIFFHWTIAILFLGQLILGYLMTGKNVDPALQFDLFQWHKSIGFLVLGLAMPRLLWSLFSRKPGPTEGAPRLETIAARAVHLSLLLLTVAVPFAGWAIASTSPLQIPSYVFDLFVMPGLPLSISDAGEDFWTTVHATLAYTAAALVFLHVAAALWHHLVHKNPILRRMLPVFGHKR